MLRSKRRGGRSISVSNALKIEKILQAFGQVLESNLKMKENWSLAILSNLSEGVFALDEIGRIVFANAAAATILGATSGDLIGRLAQEVMGWSELSSAGPTVPCALAETMKDGKTRHVSGASLRRKNGVLVSVDYTASAVREGDAEAKLGYVLNFRDVTDRIADLELRALEALVLDGVSAGQPLDELLDLIALSVDRQMPGTRTSIMLLRDGKVVDVASPGLPPTLMAAIGAGGGWSDAAAHRKAQLMVQDIATDPLWRDIRETLLSHGLLACWSIPVLDAEGNALAILSLFRPSLDSPLERDQTLVARVSNYVQLAIERTHQNEALRASEEHFRSIYDLVPVLIWEEDWSNVRAMLLDLQAQGITDLSSYVTNHPEFVDRAIKSVQVLRVNRSGATIFGADTAEELLAAKDQIIDAPESYQLFQRALIAYLAGEREYESDSVRSDIKGRQLYLYVKMLLPDFASPDTRVVLTEMDLTELTIANDRFQVVAKATSDVVWDFDVANQTVWCSEGLRTQFGLDPDDFASGKSVWSDHVHPDERDRIVTQKNDLLASTSTIWKTEYRFRRFDGRYADVRDHGTILRDRNGKAIRMIGSMLDVTEQKLIEEQLRQSQKLEAVGQLTGGIAHDFNNLLTVLLGNAEVLEEELSDKPSLQRLAKMSLDAAERGAELTSRLLAFSRKQALQPKVIDIAQLLQGMDALLRRALPENIEVKMLRAGGMWKAEVDRAQLETALLNLALNARDAMRNGGRFTIEAYNATFEDEVTASNHNVKVGHYVAIDVTDNGHGIPADFIGHIFEPFFTTKEIGKGSGLGLSMVYGFVKQSGGHIHVDSEPGVGTSFKLYFPRARDLDDAPQADPLAEQLLGGQETILVVEDDGMVREHVFAQLSSLGYRVLGASDGVKAMELLNSHPDIDLLFTDVVMPGGIGGRGLADKARLVRPELKVLFTSGYTENAMVHHGRLDDGIDLLSKPYKREQLASRIRQALDKGERGGH